ncbi:MAG: NAD(P)H-binding protein [Blautia sp.]|nr:NAD(P)H-binding protein [Blautia sp.]
MRVLLAGAFGNLGSDILRALCQTEHEIIAADAVIRSLENIDETRFETRTIDVTNTESLKGICDNVDVVITTVGLTKASSKVNNYDIDYQGNLNLLHEAEKAGVQHFAYISVINADQGKGVPMVHSKFLMEQELKKSSVNYVIYRPTGYFYDIAKVFMPMVEKGEVQLLRMKNFPSCNVVDTADFAGFIVETMCDTNKTYNVGGKETYTYPQIARMFFQANHVDGKIKTVPPCMMDILASLPKIRKEGKRDVILFSKFTMTHDCVGDTMIGEKSFRQYIKEKSYLPE